MHWVALGWGVGGYTSLSQQYLLGHALDGVCGVLGDIHARARRPRERDHVDVRVRGQRPPRRPVTLHHVVHALVQQARRPGSHPLPCGALRCGACI
jgi:hypothetical protein